MSYWYGGLYVLIEGWQELGLKDKKIDSLLSESENVNLLRRYRNGVFHFHKEYFDKKYTELISEGNNCVEWIRNLREAFSDFFLEIFNH